MSRMYVNLRRNRYVSGYWTIVPDHSTVLIEQGPFDCLGKADNLGAKRHGNPSRDSIQPYGDLPTGVYRILGWSPTATRIKTEVRRYGPAGKLVLDPLTGDAYKAKLNGRWGLLVHGGDLNAKGRLRPTYGCLRVHNFDMQQLVDYYKQQKGTDYPLKTMEVVER